MIKDFIKIFFKNLAFAIAILAAASLVFGLMGLIAMGITHTAWVGPTLIIGLILFFLSWYSYQEVREKHTGGEEIDNEIHRMEEDINDNEERIIFYNKMLEHEDDKELIEKIEAEINHLCIQNETLKREIFVLEAYKEKHYA